VYFFTYKGSLTASGRSVALAFESCQEYKRKKDSRQGVNKILDVVMNHGSLLIFVAAANPAAFIGRIFLNT